MAVSDAQGQSSHLVTVTRDYYQELTTGKTSMEELALRSFEFLLERLPKECILREFDLQAVPRYFPEYEREIKERLKPYYRLHDPQLTVAWAPRRRTLARSLRAIPGGPRAPKSVRGDQYFRDCWVRGSLPTKALLASVLLHIVLCIVPFPLGKKLAQQTELTLPQIEVTWYGPVRDLPLMDPAGAPSNSILPLGTNKPLPRRGVSAYHPRQTIISTPQVPTHPRQTLIRPGAPPEPPRILPRLPNIVQWADAAQPSKPRLEISKVVLAKLRPKKPATRPLLDLPVPDVPNLEKLVGDLNIASSEMKVPKPQLRVTPASVPHAGPQQAAQEAAPAPDMAPNANSDDIGLQRLIAISPVPAPSTEAFSLPVGNLTSRISISPQGPQPGVPGGLPSGTTGATGSARGDPGGPGSTAEAGGTQAGNGGGGNGNSPHGVSISGGNPSATSPVSGPGGIPGPNAYPASPHARNTVSSTPADPPPLSKPPTPGFDHIKPGAPPEEIFGPKRIYRLQVNMPNLASATGSWVLSFAEFEQDGEEPKPATPLNDLTGPVPLRKVDPKYPPSLISAKVEGEVVLYAIIRRDGTVDSIQLVKGIEPQLDTNAMEALARWRFRPAERRGAPVELEAIVHIPFRSAPPPY